MPNPTGRNQHGLRPSQAARDRHYRLRDTTHDAVNECVQLRALLGLEQRYDPALSDAVRRERAALRARCDKLGLDWRALIAAPKPKRDKGKSWTDPTYGPSVD